MYSLLPPSLQSSTLLLGFIGLFFSAQAYSEIYRYIDPQGRLVFTDKPKHKGYIKLKKGPGGWVINRSRGYWKRNKKKFSPTIARAAKQFKLSHHLLHAVITVESAYNPQARSKAGALGLMQLMPATAHRFGVNDPYNPDQNIHGGTQYLAYLLKLFKNDLKLALAAYNAGENAVKKYNNQIPPYRETQHYVKKVIKYYQKYKHASQKRS